MAAALALDPSGTVLKRWNTQGAGPEEKLARLEARLASLSLQQPEPQGPSGGAEKQNVTPGSPEGAKQHRKMAASVLNKRLGTNRPSVQDLMVG